MSNMFFGTGNIGKAPELRNVTVAGRQAKVLELRVFFDAYRIDPTSKSPVQDDEASFWKTVTLWNERAERAARHLVKGARIHVQGYFKGERWIDRESGEERIGESIAAEDVFMSFARVESVTWRVKSTDAGGGAGAGQQAAGE